MWVILTLWGVSYMRTEHVCNSPLKRDSRSSDSNEIVTPYASSRHSSTLYCNVAWILHELSYKLFLSYMRLIAITLYEQTLSLVCARMCIGIANTTRCVAGFGWLSFNIEHIHQFQGIKRLWVDGRHIDPSLQSELENWSISLVCWVQHQSKVRLIVDNHAESRCVQVSAIENKEWT